MGRLGRAKQKRGHQVQRRKTSSERQARTSQSSIPEIPAVRRPRRITSWNFWRSPRARKSILLQALPPRNGDLHGKSDNAGSPMLERHCFVGRHAARVSLGETISNRSSPHESRSWRMDGRKPVPATRATAARSFHSNRESDGDSRSQRDGRLPSHGPTNCCRCRTSFF